MAFCVRVLWKCARSAIGVVLSVFFFLLFVPFSTAQMKSGSEMTGFASAFALDGVTSPDFQVQELAAQVSSGSRVNVLWPGETLQMTLRFTNRLSIPLRAQASIQVIQYGTSVPAGETWAPTVFRLGEAGSTPVEVDLAPGGSQESVIHPQIPETFGGYALIADMQGHGRVFVAAIVRCLKPEPGRVEFPTYALDTTWDELMSEGVFELFEKLGVKGMRMGAPFNPRDDPEAEKSAEILDRYLTWAKAHDVTVMLTIGGGDAKSMQPLNRPRPWLSNEGKMLDTKDDRAWLPSFDHEFQRWVESITSRYGWPKGNVNAVELWNEPWEAVSISGWGADIPRYRDLFTRMALGVEAARRNAGVKVLIGGMCSSSNARDKLFPDGSDHFLKWMDFISIHYQALAADPSLVPEWIHRKNEYGPVRVWDTESWIANSEDRVPGVIASMRAQGQSRTAGIFDGNVYESKNLKIDGRVYPVVQAWSPAAAVAASQKFVGQREFKELLFKNGLPWIFVFDGLPHTGSDDTNPDDGTVVVVGDLKKIYEPDRTLFRAVTVDHKAILVMSDGGGIVRLYDFYGNTVPAEAGKISIPLNGQGYFVRTNGSPGSFAKLVTLLKSSRIDGLSPVEIKAHDLLAPIGERPVLRFQVTNVLNRAVHGLLIPQLSGASLDQPSAGVSLGPNQSREVTFRLKQGSPAASNIYPLTARFDAGPDGATDFHEDLHVNYIAKRTISIDGDLSDWDGVLPQVLPTAGMPSTLTEEAWLPFKNFGKESKSSTSVVYLAYDNNNFYFAAKIADESPDPGMVNFRKRDDDSYFYPDRVTDPQGNLLAWPDHVRHYSYRQNFDIPSGSEEHNNVQIAFNVLAEKPWLPNPSGTMPKFITYWDTDYEYALNPVASEFGGGTEVWRLLSPGMPRKHFFPRQPKAPIDGGDVDGAKLVIRHVENTRIVEASIPWTEMPEVRSKLLKGEPIKFSCRVNKNKGLAQELAAGRSVSKVNSVTFHDDWQNHWANELEFQAEQ
jgi:hypothetical protein